MSATTHVEPFILAIERAGLATGWIDDRETPLCSVGRTSILCRWQERESIGQTPDLVVIAFARTQNYILLLYALFQI